MSSNSEPNSNNNSFAPRVSDSTYDELRDVLNSKPYDGDIIDPQATLKEEGPSVIPADPTENLSQSDKENLTWLESMIASHESIIKATEEGLKEVDDAKRVQLEQKMAEFKEELEVFKKGKDRLVKKSLVMKIDQLERGIEGEWESEKEAPTDEEKIAKWRERYDIARKERRPENADSTILKTNEEELL